MSLSVVVPTPEKPDDGHIRPKHVVLLLILEYTSFM